MASHSRILNLSNNRTVKRSQALGRVEQCISVWVDANISIRDLSNSERIQARSIEAREQLQLEQAELPNFTFKPPIGAEVAYRIERRMAFEADKFYTEAIQ